MSKGIAPMGLVHTPKDWPEIESWVEKHMPEDRVHLYTAAYMAWNLACSIVNKTEEQKDD